MKAFVAAITYVILAVVYPAQSQDKPAPLSSRGSPTRVTSNASLPLVFVSVLPEVKAKTHLSVLLPSKLPKPIGNAQHAVVHIAATDGYGISIYYKLGMGDAGYAAGFSAEADPKYSPQELPNVNEVKLAHGIRGLFRAVGCGGSCAPANLCWEEGGVLYQVQLKLSPSVSERSQKSAIIGVANSAILAGPR